MIGFAELELFHHLVLGLSCSSAAFLIVGLWCPPGDYVRGLERLELDCVGSRFRGDVDQLDSLPKRPVMIDASLGDDVCAPSHGPAPNRRSASSAAPAAR